MRFIWLRTSSKPSVIIMASSVKRFISHKLTFVFLLLFVGFAGDQVKPAFAASSSDEVISVHPPFEITLKKAGSIRLAGLLFEAENTSLSSLIKTGDKVRVRILSDKPDKYGRKAALLYNKQGLWLQGELVRQGLATAYPYPGESHFIRDLYELEKPHSISALKDKITVDQFAIIQGTVVAVAEVKGTTYLNFGSNWRDDFTIRINKANLHRFKAAGFNLSSLKGQHLRIRGWVIEQNGPMIEAEYPTQIELIR